MHARCLLALPLNRLPYMHACMHAHAAGLTSLAASTALLSVAVLLTASDWLQIATAALMRACRLLTVPGHLDAAYCLGQLARELTIAMCAIAA